MHQFSRVANRLSQALPATFRTQLRYVIYVQQLVEKPSERVRMIFFVLMNALATRFPRTVHKSDMSVRFRGAMYYLGLRSGELVVFDELYRDCIYDKVEDFIAMPGWIVFDLGANVGLFSVQQAQRGARVYAFEPNPNCYRRLSKTTAANNLAGTINLFNYAVGAAPGTGTLAVPRVGIQASSPSTATFSIHSTTDGSIIPGAEQNVAEEFAVQITSLDQMVPALGVTHIDLLKIDVEGAEAEVLQGAMNILPVVDRIVVEYHSRELRDRISACLQDQGLSQVLDTASKYSAGAGLLYATRLRDPQKLGTGQLDLDIS